MTLTKLDYPTTNDFKITSEHVCIASMLLAIIPILSHYILGFSLTSFNAIFVFQIIPIVITTVIWGWNEYYPKKYIKNGTITLSFTDITIDDKKYSFDCTSNLTFDVNDFRGERKRYPYRLPAGPCLSQGENNFLIFQHNGIDFSFRYLIKSKGELRVLGEYLTQLYINGVSFKETLTGSKSYRLAHLSYNEIQSYKRKRS
jgi:hypothetical protein